MSLETFGLAPVPADVAARLPATVRRLLDRYARETASSLAAAGESAPATWQLTRAADRSTWIVVGDTKLLLAFLIVYEIGWPRRRARHPGWTVVASLLRDRSTATRAVLGAGN